MDPRSLAGLFSPQFDRLHLVIARTYALGSRPVEREPWNVLQTAGLDEVLFLDRPRTDVLVEGSFAPEANATVGRVRVRVGDTARDTLVMPPRVASRRRGKWVFEQTGRPERTPLTAELAFGGTDGEAEPPLPTSEDEVAVRLLLEAAGHHPMSYPRNPVGLGFLAADREDGAVIELPRLEDPREPLRPEELVLDVRRWWEGPIPRLFGRVPLGWFPRSALFGATHLVAPPAQSTAWPEAKRGLLDGMELPTRPGVRASGAAACAPAGMHLMVRPGDVVRVDADDKATVGVIAEPPTVRIGGWDGTFQGAPAMPGIVRLDLDRGRLDVVWYASIARPSSVQIDGLALVRDPSWSPADRCVFEVDGARFRGEELRAWAKAAEEVS